FDFSERDALLAARMLPPLVAAARRGKRLAEERRARAVVEAVAELDTRPRLALDRRGALLWASPCAAQLIGLRRAEPPPDALIAAARLAVLPGVVTVPATGSGPIRAELRLARTATGAPFVLAELDVAGAPSALSALAARAALTDAETEVLALLAHGLSDR